MNPIFSCICDEKSKHDVELNRINRTVYEMDLTLDNVTRFWEMAKKFPVLFGAPIEGNFERFLEVLISRRGDTIESNGLFWVMDNFVGIFYMTHIGWNDAQIHYSFFDRRHAGRQWITRMMIKYVFDNFPFHRLTAEIPKFSVGTFEFIKQVGLRREGVKRESVMYKNKWSDVETWGILKTEVDAWQFPGELSWA